MKRAPERYLGLPYRRVRKWREDDAGPYRVARVAEMPEVAGDSVARADAATALSPCPQDYVERRRAEGPAIARACTAGRRRLTVPGAG